MKKDTISKTVAFNTDVTFKELWKPPPFLAIINKFVDIMARQYNEDDAMIGLNDADPASRCALLTLSLFDKLEAYYYNVAQFNNELAQAITETHIETICANVIMLHKDIAKIINDIICGHIKPDAITDKMSESIINSFYTETESVTHLTIDDIWINVWGIK